MKIRQRFCLFGQVSLVGYFHVDTDPLAQYGKATVTIWVLKWIVMFGLTVT